jgi:hypothetical protein
MQRAESRKLALAFQVVADRITSLTELTSLSAMTFDQVSILQPPTSSALLITSIYTRLCDMSAAVNNLVTKVEHAAYHTTAFESAGSAIMRLVRFDHSLMSA